MIYLDNAVTRLVDQERAWRNNGLREGLTLILTKPIGKGLVNMAALNKGAARIRLHGSS